MTDSSLIVAGVILAAVFVFCGWVIKRYWIDKAWKSDANRMIGRNVLANFQNADDQERMEQVIYQEEIECDDDEQGERNGPGPEFVEPKE
ncbi:MAG: hypothetical protein ABIE70_10530 [bacterium]